MAPKTAKSKSKRAAESIGNRLQLVVKSGKYMLGYKSALKTIRANKSKLLIVASNMPPLKRSELDYYAMLGKVDVHHFHGDNNDLGTACGKYFRTSVVSITDPGDSDIVQVVKDGMVGNK
eukprot:GHVL01004502.1.p1 GENE.GHVL01004502.1~~GHVL01004502.1.p1  ORF type:complete len:120 (+),score=14.69 GHVL01004502.1:54-413(+)